MRKRDILTHYKATGPGWQSRMKKLGVQQPLPSTPNEKRVAEEYATTSMSNVMATMARSMPQFGLLSTLVVFPMRNATC